MDAFLRNTGRRRAARRIVTTTRTAEDDDVDPNVPWNEGGDQVAFDEYASKIAAAVIKALGEDPGTVTWEELDRLNQRVECLRCRKEKGANKRLVMGWRAAILHEIDKHSEDDDEDSYEAGWEGLDADSLALAHEKEKQAKNNSHIRPSGNVHCVECKKLTMEDDGRLSYGNYGFKLPEPGATECPKGHDLTKEGATYSDGWMMAFKAMPHPVKIA
ncbi:hypothetical protein DFP72DRAFT_485501 [Ephemerocybe angulata]|uniref:Uncharacterized protein n=1 Tax=Ephemerocybe angulata TaxID=980116 RepID=A0A8H6IGR9_9AGAR|nr:hypothetical protein DFP72DRAFT_485501 [Tulosesus angulatus]